MKTHKQPWDPRFLFGVHTLMFVAALVMALHCQANATLVTQKYGVFNAYGKEIAFHKQGATKALEPPGDYDWWYGCSPTAAGMIIGHYDVQGYNGRSYNNLVLGGQAEFSTFGNSGALVNNFIASPGHISGFYSGGYGVSGDDVVPPLHDFDCLADFMGTSQDNYGNYNGATSFYFFTNGQPFTQLDAKTYGLSESSGMYGIGEYLEYAGYHAGGLHNQYIDTLGLDYGFTFLDYVVEIDAGRPVMIHLNGHSMFGYGYDSVAKEILFHDTWAQGEHRMVWGGAYCGMDHLGITALEIVPEPATLLLLGMGSLALLRKRELG